MVMVVAIVQGKERNYATCALIVRFNFRPLNPSSLSHLLSHDLSFHSFLFAQPVFSMEPHPQNADSSTSATKVKKPVTIITIGMAGAGKSTFVERLNAHLQSKEPPSPPYILNLDPAVTYVPYEPNIDIRDTVNYQEVMKQFVSGLSRLTSFSVWVMN
jgi:hypothetical protein